MSRASLSAWTSFFALIWNLPTAASSLSRLPGVEPPATEGAAESYPGEVAVRSFDEGYVIAVRGEWGSTTLVVHALGAVAEFSATDPRGKVLLREGELMVVLPDSGQVLRSTLPTPTDPAPGALQAQEVRQLHSRQGTEHLLEVEGASLVSYVPAAQGLSFDELLGTGHLTAEVAERQAPAGSWFAVPSDGILHQTPPDDGGGGCTSSCSVTCPPNSNSCSATSGGWACCSCTCHEGAASCRCR